ncbi:MAG: peptide chain release factor 2 [Bacilli bacterium]|nr:peptide chain release factor 2 [Bacilli bacterium]
MKKKNQLGGHFDLPAKKEKIKELEKQLEDPTIWNNPSLGNKINSQFINLKKEVENYNKISNELTQFLELLSLSEDLELVNEIENNLNDINLVIADMELSSLLNRKYDANNCYLEIHPGAGGTESNDWAGMLLRMYELFCDKNNYSFEILNKQDGEEAGIKNALIKITGKYPYGYFKSEQGVHRLVRISPFDSGARRHTSFAAISIIPEIEDAKLETIKPEDIRVDVYRSSGKGGQGVNTTDSAVRITHLPTGIVVTCQNERSQIRNKETAMKILISKLEQIANKQKIEAISNLKTTKKIDFGSQIRNYTLEPYKLVKDVRTNYETSNTDAVLNGDILPFMEEYLRQ